MARFDFVPTPLAGLMLVQRQRIEDNRGFFSRFYCAEEFLAAGLPVTVAQINHSFTRHKGTVRGMHYQLPPYLDCKIVSCLQGEVFDVAVDLRQHSQSFLKWHGEVLSAANQRSFLIPKGFAHGFQALTDDCELLYLHSASYQADVEGAVNASDPRLDILWPLKITEISARDRTHLLLGDEFQGIDT